MIIMSDELCLCYLQICLNICEVGIPDAARGDWFLQCVTLTLLYEEYVQYVQVSGAEVGVRIIKCYVTNFVIMCV